MKKKVIIEEQIETISIKDLKRTDYIGFHHEDVNDKGFIASVIIDGQRKLVPISIEEESRDTGFACYLNAIHDTMQSAIMEAQVICTVFINLHLQKNYTNGWQSKPHWMARPSPSKRTRTTQQTNPQQ